MRKHVVPQALHDLSPDPARIVVCNVVADAAQGEQHDNAQRHLPQHLGIFLNEGAVQKISHQHDQRGIGRGEQYCPEHADEKHTGIGLGVLEQTAIDQPRIGLKVYARTRRSAQGALSSCTVAMLSWAKPKRPATSIAVTTAWCVVRASARIVMGPRSAPASFSKAARNVSGLELIRVRSLTR